MIRDFLKKHNYICLSVVLVLTSIILYWDFLGNNVLVYYDWGYDTFHQYVPVYQFYSNLLEYRNFSVYSFVYGLGTSIFTSLSWIADPFSILNVVIGAVWGIEKIPQFLVYNQILKIVCAGILCNYYLRSHNFSRVASGISSYCLAFSGYMMTTGQHYFFSVYPIYLLLLLIFVDKTMYDPTKAYQLALVSMIVAIRSPYSGYMIYLAGAIYVIFVSAYSTNGIFTTIKKVVFLGITMVLGLFMGMASFLPQAEVILQSPRIAGSQSMLEKIVQFMKLAPLETLQTAFLRLFSNHLEGTVNQWKGIEAHFEACPYFYSSIFILFAAQYFVGTLKNKYTKKKKVFRLLIMLMIIISFVFLFVPAMFNLFVEPQYRFAFIILPAFAVIVAETIDNLLYKNEFSRLTNYVVALGSFVALVCYSKQQDGNEFIQTNVIITVSVVVLGAILLDILYFFKKKEKAGLSSLACQLSLASLALLICINMLYENSITLYENRSIAEKLTYEERVKESPYFKAITDIKELEGDNFYRMETDFHISSYPDAMYGLPGYIRTLSVYDPTCNSNVSEFLSKIYGNNVFNQQIYYLGSYGATGELTTASTLGIKYLLSTKNIQDPEWCIINEYGDVKLYKNRKIETAGVLYNAYTSEKDANAETVSERQQGIAQRVIFDIIPEEIERYADEQNNVDCVSINELFLINEIEGENLVFEVNENEESISISGKASENAILTIPVDTSILLDSKMQNQFTVISENGRIFDEIYVINVDGENSRIDSQLYQSGIEENGKISYTYTIPNDTKALHFVYSDECTDFEISSIIAVSVAINYTNEGVLLKNENMGNVVTGTVSTNRNSILYLPIPYEDDWQATIDGESVSVYKANYGFCAILVPSGIHEITMQYTSKTFQIGIIISFLSLTVLIISNRLIKKFNSKKLGKIYY